MLDETYFIIIAVIFQSLILNIVHCYCYFCMKTLSKIYMQFVSTIYYKC